VKGGRGVGGSRRRGEGCGRGTLSHQGDRPKTNSSEVHHPANRSTVRRSGRCTLLIQGYGEREVEHTTPLPRDSSMLTAREECSAAQHPPLFPLRSPTPPPPRTPCCADSARQFNPPAFISRASHTNTSEAHRSLDYRVFAVVMVGVCKSLAHLQVFSERKPYRRNLYNSSHAGRGRRARLR
jgi:hypothetical protein